MKFFLNIINIALIGLVVSMGVHTFQKQVIPDTATSIDAVRSAEKPDPHKKNQNRQYRKRSEYFLICKRNLFKVQNSPEKIKPAVQPITSSMDKKQNINLHYLLLGTVTGVAEVYAVIENRKSRKQVLIQQGGKLGSYEIKSILRKKVILSDKGVEQTLSMAANNISGQKASGNQTALTSIDNRHDAPVFSPPEVKPINIILDRTQIYRSLSDTDAMKNQIKMRPHFANGISEGVIIYRLRPDSIYKKVGFHNGDILKSINAKPIDSIANITSLITQILEADTTQIKLLRRGKLLEINYAFAE